MGVPAAATEVVAALGRTPGEARSLVAALDPASDAGPGEWSPDA